ncbi:MAG: two-component system, OmpR family, response regulator [Chthoniobacter sp.]|nr:two-component system, OmpR family, response regulator [Chthoniobacter sp.]
MKKRIMIVDDEPGFIRLVKLNLERTGRYLVKEENDGTNVLETAAQFRPDLFVLDLVMPRTDGGAVAEQIRAHPAFSETPIVFLSATVVRDNEFPTNHICGFPAIAKPVSLSELIEVIETNLEAPSTDDSLVDEAVFAAP